MKEPPPSRYRFHYSHRWVAAFLLVVFLFPVHAWTQSDGQGLSLFVDAGMLMPNAKQANFYNGYNDRPNTIRRVLYSSSYGTAIWQSLKNGGYITDAVGSYSNLQVAEWADMYYKNTYQIGFGLRYGYDGGWGWLVRLDYSQLTAAGEWLLSSDNGTGIISDQGRYVRCGIYGIENRILIDVGISKRFAIDDNWGITLESGLNFNNTKVKEHEIEIVGNTYSILDVWDGATPYDGIGTYEYVNQGGVGYGGYFTVAASYELPGYGAVDVGYSCYYMQTRFPNYNPNDAFALQHVVFLRANLYNFIF